MRVRFNFAAVNAKMREGGRKGLRDAGERLLQAANRSVPLEEGTLARSADVDANEKAAHVFYRAPYAVRQHEDMTYRHAPGRRAKWLELSCVERKTDLLHVLARGLDRALR